MTAKNYLELIKNGKLSEEDARRIIREVLLSHSEKKNNRMLVEFAIKRRLYKTRLDSIMPQVIENWCLARYCTLSGFDENLKSHWKSELRGHIATLFRLAIKGNDSDLSRRQVLKEIWIDNDFDDPNVIKYVTYAKFKKENIDTNSELYYDTISDFVFHQEKLINVIVSRDLGILEEYLETI